MMHEQNPYTDILTLPHHKAANRPHMSMHDRAAQFSPFAALTGFDGVIAETGRMTDQKAELSESQMILLMRTPPKLRSQTGEIEHGFR